MDDGDGARMQGRTAQVPEPWEPPKLPRGLIAARHHALDTRVRELEEAGARADGSGSKDRLLREAIRRRNQARGLAKSAGGLTQRKLNFELMAEATNINKFEKAVEKGRRDVEEAKEYVQEALRYQEDAERALEAAEQKLRNSQDRRAWLATNLAAETNAQRHGGVHEAFATLRLAVHTGLPLELRQKWDVLEGFFQSVAPAAAQFMADDPALRGLGGSEAGTSVAGDAVGEEDIGDLIMQSDLVTARADLADLVKQRDEAVAIAIRQGGSQEHARGRFDGRICEARERIQRTEALLSTGAPAEPKHDDGDGSAITRQQLQQRQTTTQSKAASSPSLVPARVPPTPEYDDATTPVAQQATDNSTHGAECTAQGRTVAGQRRAGSEPRGPLAQACGRAQVAPCAAALPAAFATAERAASARRYAAAAEDEGMEGVEDCSHLPAASLTRRRREIRDALDGMAKRAAERMPLRAARASPVRGRGRSRSERDFRAEADDDV